MSAWRRLLHYGHAADLSPPGAWVAVRGRTYVEESPRRIGYRAFLDEDAACVFGVGLIQRVGHVMLI
jgi:hypothetical protein